jgi:predicted  nucleic acid-binding Zn-ribbon protein
MLQVEDAFDRLRMHEGCALALREFISAREERVKDWKEIDRLKREAKEAGERENSLNRRLAEATRALAVAGLPKKKPAS